MAKWALVPARFGDHPDLPQWEASRPDAAPNMPLFKLVAETVWHAMVSAAPNPADDEELVEMVARALATAQGIKPGAWILIGMKPAEAWEARVPQARAVIDALSKGAADADQAGA